MANYVSILALPDEHIEFLQAHPDALTSYVEGCAPPHKGGGITLRGLLRRLTGSTVEAVRIPADWPQREAEIFGPEINHRNVDLHHEILNGTPEGVSGSGSIFQTWFNPRRHSALHLGDDNEVFAFLSSQVPELLALVSKVDKAAVRRASSSWSRRRGQVYEPDDEECSEIVDEYQQFAAKLSESLQRRLGIAWFPG